MALTKAVKIHSLNPLTKLFRVFKPKDRPLNSGEKQWKALLELGRIWREVKV